MNNNTRNMYLIMLSSKYRKINKITNDKTLHIHTDHIEWNYMLFDQNFALFLKEYVINNNTSEPLISLDLGMLKDSTIIGNNFMGCSNVWIKDLFGEYILGEEE